MRTIFTFFYKLNVQKLTKNIYKKYFEVWAEICRSIYDSDLVKWILYSTYHVCPVVGDLANGILSIDPNQYLTPGVTRLLHNVA